MDSLGLRFVEFSAYEPRLTFGIIKGLRQSERMLKADYSTTRIGCYRISQYHTGLYGFDKLLWGLRCRLARGFGDNGLQAEICTCKSLPLVFELASVRFRS